LFKGTTSGTDAGAEPTFDTNETGFTFADTLDVITSPGESTYVFHEAFTIKLWFNLDTPTGTHSLIEKKGKLASNLIQLKADATNFTFTLTTKGGQTGNITASTVTGSWCTIMLTSEVNGTPERVNKMYVDNQAPVSFNISSSTTLDDLKERYTFMIGNNTADEFFIGKIWEV
jgi:hypothetical protein